MVLKGNFFIYFLFFNALEKWLVWRLEKRESQDGLDLWGSRHFRLVLLQPQGAESSPGLRGCLGELGRVKAGSVLKGSPGVRSFRTWRKAQGLA